MILTYIHKLRENACKAKHARNEIYLGTKQRKHLIKTTSKEGHPPRKTDSKGAKHFLGHWLIQANAHGSSQRIEDCK